MTFHVRVSAFMKASVSQTFEVEADNEDDAKEDALSAAEDAFGGWSIDDAEYEYFEVEEVDKLDL